MSLFIDLVETFDMSSLTSYPYARKIERLIDRFPNFKKDCRYRSVLPEKLAKSSDDYMSIKLCTPGRVPVYGIYNKSDVYLVGVCVQGTVFALDNNDFHASFVPDLKFRKIDLGIQNTPLAATESISYTKESMCSAISTLSLGYTPEKKNEWCNAVVLLIGTTSQAVRFHEMKRQTEIGLQTTVYHDRGFYPHSRILGLINRWNKISMAIRRGECPYIFAYYVTHRQSSRSTVCEQSTGKLTLSLINDKGRTEREKFRKTIAKLDEKRVRKRIIWKRMEKDKLKVVIRLLRIDLNRNCWMKKTNNKRLWESMNNSHGYWYGSVDTLKFKVAPVKCLLRPNLAVIDDRFFLCATPTLDPLEAVLQTQITLASILGVVTSIWNESGLLSFSRVYKDPILEALRALYRAIAECTCPVFTAADFYLRAKRHKVKVDELYLIENCGTSKSEFNRVLASRKDLSSDQFRILKGKKDLSEVKWNQVETRPCVQLGCGRFWGALGATCVYPSLALRTRVQAQQLNSNDECIGKSVFGRILRHHHEDLRGFYVTSLMKWTKGLLMKK